MAKDSPARSCPFHRRPMLERGRFLPGPGSRSGQDRASCSSRVCLRRPLKTPSMRRFSGRAPLRLRSPLNRLARASAAAAVLLLAARRSPASTLRVVNTEGHPIAGAHVEVLEHRAAGGPLAAMFPAYAEGETGEEGRFPRSVPRRDGLLILVDHPAYLPWAQPASATPAEIVLQPGRTWRGRLTVGSREHQKGRSCASWKQAFPAWRETRRWQRCGEVSTTGELSLTGLKDGEVDLDIQVPGFLHFRRSTTLPPRTPLKLLAGSLVTGRVVGVGSATGIPKALIRSEGGSPVESQADGVFAIAVAKLPAQIQVSAAGFRDLQVTAGKPLPQGGLVVRLVPGEQLRGTLFDEERKPVPKALLWIEEQTEGRFRSESRPVDTRDGAFTVDLQGPGRYRLRFQAEGFREEPLPEVSVSPGESRTLGAITLHRGGGLLGTAVDTLTREP